MDEVAAGTPTDKPNVAEPATQSLPKGGQPVQQGRTLRDIIHELNDTVFFSLRRYRLKQEFLNRLRDPNVTANMTLLQDFVLAALLKYVSRSESHSILRMTRANNESAISFAVGRLKCSLQKIKYLVEAFKIPVDPQWVSLSEDPEIKSYLQQHTALYVAAQTKDVNSFKVALKKQEVSLTEYAGLSIVDFIQSKISENQGRNAVVRYFLNRRWNRMLRAVTGQIKKQLLKQAKDKKAVSAELLDLLNQCPIEEIYSTLLWEDQDDNRLYDIFKTLDLREYLNIYLQMARITSEESGADLVLQMSKVSSSLKIVAQVGGPVAPDKQEASVQQERQPVPHEPDARTRFHQYLRDNDELEITTMLRQQLLSIKEVEEVLDSSLNIDKKIRNDLQDYRERLQNSNNGSGVRRALSFTQ